MTSGTLIKLAGAKLAFIIQSGSQLSESTCASCSGVEITNSYAWFEGKINMESANTIGLSTSAASFFTSRNSLVTSEGTALKVLNSNYIQIENSILDAGDYAMSLDGSSYGTFHSITATSDQTTETISLSTSSSNVFEELDVHSNLATHDNLCLGLWGQSNSNTFTNLALTNYSGIQLGLVFDGNFNPRSNHFTNLNLYASHTGGVLQILYNYDSTNAPTAASHMNLFDGGNSSSWATISENDPLTLLLATVTPTGSCASLGYAKTIRGTTSPNTNLACLK